MTDGCGGCSQDSDGPNAGSSAQALLVRGRAAMVAVVGNPNTGKTSLFNALTGFRRHVANYPGVTVEAGTGPLRGATRAIELLDLPGTYSLAAMSPDEMIVSNVLCGRVDQDGLPDAILAVVDASNLKRNLYMVTQLLEIGLPIVVAVNMVDVARAKGIGVDCELLAERLGVPVVPVVAIKPATIKPLVSVLEACVGASPSNVRVDLPEALREEVAAFDTTMRDAEVIRILLDRDGYAPAQYLEGGGSQEQLDSARARLQDASVDGAATEVQARYRWIGEKLVDVITRPTTPIVTWTERLDNVLTHRVGGVLTLLVVLFFVFRSIFTWAVPLMTLIESSFGWLAGMVGAWLPAGALRSLISDGLIGGVGGVLVFLPQILILFGLIALLEDCGYMARAAFMMDRLMRSFGLSGRSFLPLMSSFACAVPAIMGTRTIADKRERFVTILIAPFMSCSARLPVYVLMISAFVPATSYLSGWVPLQGLVMFSMYIIGVLVALPLAWLLKRTAFAGASTGFMLELPTYKMPRVRAVAQRMFFAGKRFLVRAGTVILVVNMIVWALGYFPHGQQTRDAVAQRAALEQWDAARAESELAGAYLRDSYLGRMGNAIEPVVEPIGWDWRIGIAVIASFPAREVVIGTLGTIYNLGAEQDEQSNTLRGALIAATWHDSDRAVFTLPVAISIMVFFALCAQCSSTLVTIGREMRSWSWPLISFLGMTTLAYLAAWAVAAGLRAAGL